jgi:hypothetical protein
LQRERFVERRPLRRDNADRSGGRTHGSMPVPCKAPSQKNKDPTSFR